MVGAPPGSISVCRVASVAATGEAKVWAIVGARLLYVITEWQEFSNPLDIILLNKGGLVAYGGMLGGLAASWYGCRRRRIPLLRWADASAPSVVLGTAITRVGCLLFGCDYGKVAHVPWAIRFPEGNPLGSPTYPVHPTEVYESLLNLGLYAALAWLFRRKNFDGQIFGVYLVSYAVLRSFVEMFRGDYPEHYLGGWATPAHLISMAIFAAGLALLFLLPRPEAKRG